jgi:transcriptional regulator with XRE-family HTH domain
METKTGNKHKGMQVKRFREAIGMKQETLAHELGTTQQNISYYEKQEDLDDGLFNQLAKGMGVEPEVLKDFSDETAVNIFSNAFHDNSSAGVMYNPTFNPIDKIVEQAAKIEELYKELLQSERDKIEVLTNTNKAVLELAEEVRKMKEAKK